jgi:hypothetical protein
MPGTVHRRFEGDMLPTQEFRRSCLRSAANDCSAIQIHGGSLAIRHSITFVVYMLAVFALRRNGLAPRELRAFRTTSSPSIPFIRPGDRRTPRLAHSPAQPHTPGRLAIAYQ